MKESDETVKEGELRVLACRQGISASEIFSDSGSDEVSGLAGDDKEVSSSNTGQGPRTNSAQVGRRKASILSNASRKLSLKRPSSEAPTSQRQRPFRKVLEGASYNIGDVVLARYQGREYSATIESKRSIGYILEYRWFNEDTGHCEFWQKATERDSILQRLDEHLVEERLDEHLVEVEDEKSNQQELQEESPEGEEAEERIISIIFDSSKFKTFEEADKKQKWSVGEKDKDGDYDLWGTNGGKIQGQYKKMWAADTGAWINSMFPMTAKWPGKTISEFERYILRKGSVKEYKSACVRVNPSKGFYLPETLFRARLPPVRETAMPELNQKKRGPGVHAPSQKNMFLLHMLRDLALSMTPSQLYNQHGKSVVSVCGAIVETVDGCSWVFDMKKAKSQKGTWKEHAEEIVLKELGDVLDNRCHEHIAGSTKHLKMLVLHGSGGKEDGSICGGCICAIGKFVAQKGLDPTKTEIIHPFAGDQDKKLLGPMATLQRFQRASIDENDVAFWKCKMNSYQQKEPSKCLNKLKDAEVLLREQKLGKDKHYAFCPHKHSKHLFERFA